MPIPTGNWTLIADGNEGTLQINGVDAAGVVNFILSVVSLDVGTNVNEFRAGFWNESSQTITLHLTTFFLAPAVGTTSHRASFSFEGCLFRTPATPAPGQDVLLTLNGHFTMTGAAGGLVPNSRRHRFGWHATITQTL